MLPRSIRVSAAIRAPSGPIAWEAASRLHGPVERVLERYRDPPTGRIGVSELTRQRVRVYGMVQGVFFRDSCRQEALRQGVAGWVRNAGDGSVEAVFEGDAEAVEAMC